jgi:hypothetical protein
MTKTFSRTDILNFTVSSPSNMSLAACCLYCQELYLISQYIFLSLLLKYSECVGFFQVIIQESDILVRMGFIRDLHIFNLVLQAKNLDLNSLMCAKYPRCVVMVLD